MIEGNPDQFKKLKNFWEEVEKGNTPPKLEESSPKPELKDPPFSSKVVSKGKEIIHSKVLEELKPVTDHQVDLVDTSSTSMSSPAETAPPSEAEIQDTENKASIVETQKKESVSWQNAEHPRLRLQQTASKIDRFINFLLNLLPTSWRNKLNFNRKSSSSSIISETRENVLNTREVTRGTTRDHGSQGLFSSAGKSLVYIHDSTVAKEFYHPSVGFHNSDRGGVGHNKDGTNFGVLFDGAGSSLPAMKAAQAFTEKAMSEIVSNHTKFNGLELNKIKQEAIHLFQECANSNNAGEATAVFATFAKKKKGMFQVNGASLGDTVAIHLNRQKGSAERINEVSKKDMKDKTEAGGLIYSRDPNHEHLQQTYPFSKEISENDVVILASDALADCIQEGSLNDIIPLIAFSSKFDKSVEDLQKENQPWLNTDPVTLPTIEQLQDFVKEEGILNLDTNVNNEIIAKRLNTYVKFINDNKRKFDAKNKSFEWDLVDKKIPDKEIGKLLDEYIKGEEYQTQKKKMIGKTDDCMIMVLSPSGY